MLGLVYYIIGTMLNNGSLEESGQENFCTFFETTIRPPKLRACSYFALNILKFFQELQNLKLVKFFVSSFLNDTIFKIL